MEIDIESSFRNHIDVTVNKNSGEPWRFTGFYNEPETHKRLGIYYEVYMGRTRFPSCVLRTLMKLLSSQKNWEEG